MMSVSGVAWGVSLGWNQSWGTPKQSHIYGNYRPFAKLLRCMFYCVPSAILGVYLGMDHMSLSQRHGNQIVDVCGEALEASLVAHESMDVDEQQLAAAMLVV